MGLLEQEIEEIRGLTKNLIEGKISRDDIAPLIGLYNQTSKRVNHILQISALGIKGSEGKKAQKRMVDANIISQGSALAIDNKNPELDMVICPLFGGKSITREDCLDSSGEERNISECQNCQHFTTTRRLLLP